MPTYRLRVEVPLEPAEPTSVTKVIDALGGDVVSVDLREIDDQLAIDEMVIEFAHDPSLPSLSRVLENESAATLLSSQKCGPDEPITRALDWARTSMRDRSELAAPDLPERLSAACPLSRVSIRAAEDAASLPVVEMALARGGPVVHRCGGLAQPEPPTGDRSAWLLAAADQYPDARLIGLVARPLSLRFTAQEVARVEMVMGTGTPGR
jgi:hypothetical protein